MISGANRESFILNVGCYESPILPMLKRLGFINLYGCDLVLKTSSDCNPSFNNNTNNSSSFKYHEDYEPIAKMYGDKSYHLSIRNLKYKVQRSDV